jgi:hypothetical protein
MQRRVACPLVLTLVLAAGWTHALRAQPAPPSEPAGVKAWLSGPQTFEAFLREAKVVGRQAVPVGVTRPTRCQLEPGGPVAEMAWKPIKPGFYSGYRESYMHEIAAYELDKLLKLDMVPPTVERQLDGVKGAAVMWVSPTRSFKELGGAPTAPPAHAASWNRQLSRAKLFDNLIANIDPNLGNWLVDPAWNLILIDHTRSFTTTNRLVHEMTRIDWDLWSRMQALDEPALQSALGQWLGRSELRAILERRDRMAKNIAQMVARSTEAAVYIK